MLKDIAMKIKRSKDKKRKRQHEGEDVEKDDQCMQTGPIYLLIEERKRW